MAERKSLIQGLKAQPVVDPSLEKKFVYGETPTTGPDEAPPVSAGEEGRGQTAGIRRLPLTTRVREDFARALKRASLERQLAGQQPNTLQDILEEALEPWLRSNKYLD